VKRFKPGAPERGQVSVKPTADERAFVVGLGFRTAPTAIQTMVEELRSFSRLPAPVVERLQRDALRLKLNPLEYVRLALHQRYEQLAADDRKRAPKGH